MSSSRPSSPGSAPCRLEWRPSRWLQAALVLLSALAPLAVMDSHMPRLMAWPLALASLGIGLRQAWVEARRPRRLLVLAAASRSRPASGGAARDMPVAASPDQLDGRPFRLLAVAWRGPLAFVHGLDGDGRACRLAWWPDTLPPGARRELRLAVAARTASRHRRPMAP